MFNSSKKTVEIANVKRKSKILDIGCGTGSLLFILSKDKTLELHGFDLSEEMLKVAKEKLKNKANLKLISVRKFKENYKKIILIIFLCQTPSIIFLIRKKLLMILKLFWKMG